MVHIIWTNFNKEFLNSTMGIDFFWPILKKFFMDILNLLIMTLKIVIKKFVKMSQ
jgi:hypothetical protein